MIHWGLYSLYAGEYKGERQPKQNLSEWIQKNYAIPNAEYEKLADAFNPLYFDADEWVTLAKNAGMKYMVFTAKHHDGFSLFHSKVDPYNIVDATPFKRDVVKELADACKKQGIKFGVYYSQDMDWHEPNGGGYKKTGSDCRERSNSWDYPDADKKDYSICFEKKIKPQVEELLTNYGDIFLIWFDMPSSITPEQSEELYNLVKKHQPNSTLKAWFMENVVNSKRYLQTAYTFKDLGLTDWANEHKISPNKIAIDLFENTTVINSADYGSIQARKRVISGEIIKQKKPIILING